MSLDEKRVIVGMLWGVVSMYGPCANWRVLMELQFFLGNSDRFTHYINNNNQHGGR